MAKYIDVEELLQKLPNDLPYKASVKRVLIQAPAADVVEVVRCKDCTEWDKDECECSHWYGFKENDYCSYGERKSVTDTNVGGK